MDLINAGEGYWNTGDIDDQSEEPLLLAVDSRSRSKSNPIHTNMAPSSDQMSGIRNGYTLGRDSIVSSGGAIAEDFVGSVMQ